MESQSNVVEINKKSSEKIEFLQGKECEVKLHCHYDKLLNPEGLEAHEYNNNHHPEKQLKVMEESLKVNGFRKPIIINKDGKIVAGHGVVQTAIRLGLDKVPTVTQEFENKIDEVRFLTSDNEVARLSEFKTAQFNDFRKNQKKVLTQNNYQVTFFSPKHFGMDKWPSEKAEKTRKEAQIIIKENQTWRNPSTGFTIEIGSIKEKNAADYTQKFLKGFRKKFGSAIILMEGSSVNENGLTFEEYAKLFTEKKDKPVKPKTIKKKASK